ncbi:hypothetical protein DPMN_009943 [Dreissena polymorpha]|uniref:Uncharacterized protein n=1 Tax=Dreissena polymorpha TaxID=45954 RepID=A0A9D4RYN6_DREPO|nr:hypothetical protein DPMN_009943 [Dreissena polymorpha]
MLLEQHLDSARTANCCVRSIFLLQQNNSAVVVFAFYRVHRDGHPYGHRPQKDVLVGYGG